MVGHPYDLAEGGTPCFRHNSAPQYRSHLREGAPTQLDDLGWPVMPRGPTVFRTTPSDRHLWSHILRAERRNRDERMTTTRHWATNHELGLAEGVLVRRGRLHGDHASTRIAEQPRLRPA